MENENDASKTKAVPSFLESSMEQGAVSPVKSENALCIIFFTEMRRINGKKSTGENEKISLVDRSEDELNNSRICSNWTADFKQ